MLRQILKYRAAVVICLLMVLCSSEAFAWGGGHRGGGHRGGYYYRGGRWYQHGWFGFDIAVAALTIGALVDALPPRHSTVVVGGVPYYYCEGVYYRPYSSGYVVVPAPVITQAIIANPEATQPIGATIRQPQAQGPGVVTINIPNARGGYTPITLKKWNNGFIGPQGEYYSEHPTVEQLQTLYGG